MRLRFARAMTRLSIHETPDASLLRLPVTHTAMFSVRATRFPYPPDATFIPAEDAPKEALYALNDRLGLAALRGRAVELPRLRQPRDGRRRGLATAQLSCDRAAFRPT